MIKTLFALTTILLIVRLHSSGSSDERPNILWITSEDNMPMLGCYGDPFVDTPNLDRLASRGFLYKHAYAPSPVCAPTRNSLITGVYANSAGNQHMRSNYRKSDKVLLYPQLLRQAGYYCTNNFKEDFNIETRQTAGLWDELGNKAHYRNRKSGQPFFAIFNSHLTHESTLHLIRPDSSLHHRPEEAMLPPYLPDTPEMRHDWAQYYDNVEKMDAWVGSILEELKESGEAENTIVFYYSDHGGVLPRSKRFLYETGTHIPFIVYIPEKYKSLRPIAETGSRLERMISLIDLPPTLMSLLGLPIPDFMQGQAFLGPGQSAEREYVFFFRDRQEERYDLFRGVRDKKYRYIRNYMPHRIYGQHALYPWLSQAYRSWEAACRDGKCNTHQSAFWHTKPAEELYFTENDPWEVHNLADDPDYREVLERMRTACQEWMIRIRDTGFIAEGDLIERLQERAAYDYMREEKPDVAAMIDAAELASGARGQNTGALLALLLSDDAALRYWGATGLSIGQIPEKQRPGVVAGLKKALDDSSPNVAIASAEALYRLGETAEARKALIAALGSDSQFVRVHALNVIDCLGEAHPDTRNAIISMVRRSEKIDRNFFDLRGAKWFFEKWKIDPGRFGIDLNWKW